MFEQPYTLQSYLRIEGGTGVAAKRVQSQLRFGGTWNILEP